MQQYLLEITISWKQRCSVNLEIAKNFFIEDQNIRSLWRTTSHTDNCGYGLKGKANLLRTERLSKLVQRADEFIQKTWVHKEWSYYPIERANAIPKGNTVVQMPKAQKNRLTFITTYDRTNPDIKEVPQKHWHLLQFEPLLETVFSEPLIIAFKRNENFGDILGSKNLNDSKIVPHKRSYTIKRCKLCTENISKKCCKQLKDTNSFKSVITRKEYKTFHDCNCLSKNLIYLMECLICNKQYVGKTQSTL